MGSVAADTAGGASVGVDVGETTSIWVAVAMDEVRVAPSDSSTDVVLSLVAVGIGVGVDEAAVTPQANVVAAGTC